MTAAMHTRINDTRPGLLYALACLMSLVRVCMAAVMLQFKHVQHCPHCHNLFHYSSSEKKQQRLSASLQ